MSKNSKKSSNVVKMNSSFSSQNFIHTRKVRVMLFIILIIFVLLIVRLGFIQFVEGNSLKEQAYKQQTINQIISPKRGNIYDSTGQSLAISAPVDTITINPAKIKDKTDEKTKTLRESIAKTFSDIFELDYEETLGKLNSDAQVETIAKKVDKNKVDQLKQWMSNNNVSVGINIDEDTKRYYPHATVASNVIGFCGNDNQGLSGIENEWDSVLTGTPGKIVSSQDGGQKEIPNAKETYISAENGSDLTLTIDFNIQTIVEKYLKQAVEQNKCSKGGNVVVMDPKTGDILAMACYPNYDLNSPFIPIEGSSYANGFSELSQQDQTNTLYKMWSNKSVAETYEPGSTFKVITSSVAIEENITTPDKEGDFICTGAEHFANGTVEIHCWRDYNPHGRQSLRTALGNSCNPAFMQLGRRIGAPTLYKYYDAFGLFEPTNVGLYGEQTGVFHNLENVGEIELATMSFGQRITVTPLQLITAISCVANDGILMKPRIVKQVTNTDTGAVTEIPTTQVRQVISKQTSETVKSMMEYVVTKGTGGNAAVSGYSIGGKTGTSEPLEENKQEGYVASYVAISPVEDTKVSLLLTLYDPKGKDGYQGGQVAGPVVAQMLSEILPYLNIPSNNTSSSSNSDNLIEVPDVRNKTVTEAEKILKSAGFTVNISSIGDNNVLLVNDQTPKPGISLAKNSIIMIYSEGSTVSKSVAVPDLKGMSVSQATATLRERNLNLSADGTGTIITQDYVKDEQVPEGTVIRVTLKKALTDAH